MLGEDQGGQPHGSHPGGSAFVTIQRDLVLTSLAHTVAAGKTAA